MAEHFLSSFFPSIIDAFSAVDKYRGGGIGAYYAGRDVMA